MNILDKVLHFKSDDDAAEIEPEISEEEARKQRIQFHRDKVRNGPVKFSSPTNGQVRRAEKRFLAGRTRAARRNQVRSYFLTQKQAAILRGQLQAAGVVEYHSPDFFARPEQSLRSVVWLVERFADDSNADEFGQIVLDEPTVRQALQSALNRYQGFVGEPITTLPEDYVLPVRLAA